MPCGLCPVLGENMGPATLSRGQGSAPRDGAEPPPPPHPPASPRCRLNSRGDGDGGQGGGAVLPCHPVVPKPMRLCCLSVCLCPPPPPRAAPSFPHLSSSPAPTSPGTFLFDLRSASHPPQLQPSPLAFPILLPFISLLPPVPAPAPLQKRCHGVGVGTKQGHPSVSRSLLHACGTPFPWCWGSTSWKLWGASSWGFGDAVLCRVMSFHAVPCRV